MYIFILLKLGNYYKIHVILFTTVSLLNISTKHEKNRQESGLAHKQRCEIYGVICVGEHIP